MRAIATGVQAEHLVETPVRAPLRPPQVRARETRPESATRTQPPINLPTDRSGCTNGPIRGNIRRRQAFISAVANAASISAADGHCRTNFFAKWVACGYEVASIRAAASRWS